MNYSPELIAAPKSSRYRIMGLLGRGATSLVYRAFDIEKQFTVALKSVRFAEQDGIYRIKQEFKFFLDFYHPNIVMLYDLHVEDNVCFYTMELIEGLDFVTFVRSHDSTLRSCFAQLTDALAAVHEAGRLHRDLKPSNILVESSERTVLLDFGLATEFRSSDSILTQTQLYAGTPAYMAPEQLTGEAASEASDLYALGVILYQSLTGRLPYPDRSPVARHEAQKSPPASPRETDSDIPRDLSDLALRLLSFDPRNRPQLAEVKRFARTPDTQNPASGRQWLADRLNQPFLGRDASLKQLENALAKALSGRRVTVHVSGVSGVGKTTLIERFLAGARDQVGVLTLRSRCHHQEAVRFNAVDGLIDMLSRYLVNESEGRLAQIVPDNLAALATMFPVLNRVPWPHGGFEQDPLPGDPQTMARNARDALRQLLRRIATGRPIVLWIDDLQWSDAGSLPLLRDIAGAGGDKPILSIFSYRTEDIQPDSVVAALELESAVEPHVEVERVVVQPLDPFAIKALLQSLADAGEPHEPAWVDEVTQQSAGLPFFVIQFAAHRHSSPDTGGAGVDGMNAGGVLDRRLRGLPQQQRTALEIVSVAGRPLAEETLVRIIARTSASGREIYQLLNQNLLRKSDARGRRAVETYHDRIREAVLDSLPPATRRLRHREIAEELARVADLDHPLLVEHFLGAGELRVASDHAILAGREATERLAFSQAAEFLLLATRLRDPLGDNASLAVELADALADAGRSSESANLFLTIASAHDKDPAAASLFRARAAQQLLYSGRLSEGRAAYRKLFTDLGMTFPETVHGAQRMALVNRAVFAIGLSRLMARPTGEARRRAEMRVDTLWAASKGFLMLDYVVGDALFTRYMREAAALGERSRMMRALALEAAVMANIGQRWSMRRAETLLRRGQELAGESPEPYDLVVLGTCRTGVVWHSGRWREAAEMAQEALTLHRRDRVRYDFELAITQGYRGSALTMLGSIQQAKVESLEAIENARARGDTYVSRFFGSSYYVYVALAEDNPDLIIADSYAVLDDLPTDRFTSLHWAHFLATVNAYAYADRAWDAWALVQRQWPLIRNAGFLKLGSIGAQMREIRARAALKAARDGSPPTSLGDWTRERLMSAAEEDAQKISVIQTQPHAAATAAAIRSGIAALCGEPQRRQMLLETAARGFAEAGMRLHQAGAELEIAKLASRGGDASRAPAWRTMLDEGVRRPDRMAAFYMCVL